MIVGQGPTALAVGAGGGCLDIFSLIYLFSFLSPSLRETARYRLKYCLEGPLIPKQPTNHIADNGHWHTHIESILASAYKILGIIRNLKYTFSRTALIQIYISYLSTRQLYGMDVLSKTNKL